MLLYIQGIDHDEKDTATSQDELEQRVVHTLEKEEKINEEEE